jgi:hypothetical protein
MILKVYLEKIKKVVYLGHHRFLPTRHLVRRKGEHFKGEANHRYPPYPCEDLFAMVNDLKVIFGKGPGSQSIPNDTNGHTPMWKKKIYILGATLLKIPRGSLCNRRDARDEESLREPTRLIRHVWEDKRYTGSTIGPTTYEKCSTHH